MRPGLLILIPGVYLVGGGLKKVTAVADKWIPLILGGAGVILAAVWVLASAPMGSWQEVLLAVFTAVVQGILCAGASVFVNQLIKQNNTDK